VPGHFVIDVNPELLHEAASGLTELGHQLDERAQEVRGTPGQIPPAEWSGEARTAITGEMTALGEKLAGFGPRFAAAGAAVRVLAATVETAVTATVPALNRRWEDAQTAYSAAVGKAGGTYELEVGNLGPEVTGTARTAALQNLQNARKGAVGQAEAVRAGAEGRLNREFNTLVEELARAFTTAGAALAENTVIPVPDDVVGSFLAAGGKNLTWTGPDGRNYPPRLDKSGDFVRGLPLTDHRQAVLDGERAAEYLDGWRKNDDEPPPPLDPEIEELFRQRGKDPYFGQTVATKLGPQGVIDVVRKAADWTGPNTVGGRPRYSVPDYDAEIQRLLGMQDTVAGWMSGVVATGSTAPGGLPGFAKDLVEKDPQIAGWIFKYADKQNLAFGGTFMHEAGVSFKNQEALDQHHYTNRYQNYDYRFGTSANPDEEKDPVVWFLRAADNSVDSAQGLFGDRDVMEHFLTHGPGGGKPPLRDRPEFGRGEQAANILRVATIEAARTPVPPGTDPTSSDSYRAAQIASNALDIVGQKDLKPYDGVKPAIAGIVATYLPDVDRAFRVSDSEVPGVYDHSTGKGWPPGITGEDGYATFGIRLDRDGLRDVLGDIGDDEDARKLIGQATTMYNAGRLRNGAEAMAAWTASGGAKDGTSNPFVADALAGSQLQGFLVDAMVTAEITDAEERAAARQSRAEAFMLPLDYLAMDKLPVVLGPPATFGMDYVKDGLVKGYVGEGVPLAVDGANSDWDTARDLVKLQAINAAREAGLLTPEELAEWPKDEVSGRPIPMQDLTPAQRTTILQETGKQPGSYAAAVLGAVDTGYDNYVVQYGDK
jgi:hypothetical protein